MTICLITSFAPVRGGSAIRLEPLPVGHQLPFSSFAYGRRKSRPADGKAGIEAEGSFRLPTTIPVFFTVPRTDVKIRQAKAGNKPTKITDGNGLYLEVRPSDSMLWRYRYRIAGKENLFAIDEYHRHQPPGRAYGAGRGALAREERAASSRA
ncbi:Arm DNA-binding domain-containing protein [Burkholderia ambifaria]|uniref:Arm DNA-binding domain-containing protein n=1 Tax=Burkholderia ambifaria TaxID=152480 RepID=UPI001E62D2CD|nr:Arm DNA-binding domain-containing protein [Burkholderia ambifaria]UEP46936.1 Arm DNA-binding domain-containing protein [Burkholderia ambifaria]